MNTFQRWGKLAEDAALEYFLARTQGRLVARNYRIKGGELDLVFEERNREKGAPELIFVEVRARAQGSAIRGVDSVDHKKRAKIRRAIRHFLFDYRGPCKTMRFDILDWDGRGWVHIRNQRLE